MSTHCQLTLYFVGDIVVCLFAVGPTFTTTSLTYNLLVDSDAVFICSVSVNPSPVCDVVQGRVSTVRRYAHFYII